MKSKLFLLLALSAFILGACARNNTSSVSESSVAPAPSSETTSTSESSEQSSEQSSEESSESESSSEEERVTELNVSGVIAPVAGETTSISDLTLDKEDATIDYDACWWFYLSNEDEYIFAEADQSKAFEQGTQYGIKLVVDLENKLFSDDPDMYLLFDNGDALAPERVQVYPGNTRMAAYFYFPTLPGPKPLHKMNMVNYPVPEIGEVSPKPWNFLAFEPANLVRVDQANTYWIYYPYGPNSGYFFSRGGDDTKVFEAGMNYSLKIVLEVKDEDEAEFAEDFSIKANGVNVRIERFEEDNTSVRLIIDFGTL